VAIKAYVVDDQRAIVELLMLLFGEIGVEAFGTTDSRHAQEAIAATQPDLVLLDIMMPDPDGLSLLALLKDDARTRDIPAVLCTASVITPSQSSLFADKSVGVLSKPFTIEQLEELVAAVEARKAK